MRWFGNPEELPRQDSNRQVFIFQILTNTNIRNIRKFNRKPKVDFV